LKQLLLGGFVKPVEIIKSILLLGLILSYSKYIVLLRPPILVLQKILLLANHEQ